MNILISAAMQTLLCDKIAKLVDENNSITIISENNGF
jgi:hypothetical protein